MAPDFVQFAQMISLVQSHFVNQNNPSGTRDVRVTLVRRGHLKGTHQQDSLIHSESVRTDTRSQLLSFSSQVPQGYVHLQTGHMHLAYLRLRY